MEATENLITLTLLLSSVIYANLFKDNCVNEKEKQRYPKTILHIYFDVCSSVLTKSSLILKRNL